MASDKAGVKSERARATTNENPSVMMTAKFTVTTKDGLWVGGEEYAKGDEVTLREDVAKVLLRQGVIEQE